MRIRQYDPMIGIPEEKPAERKISMTELCKRWLQITEAWGDLYGYNERYSGDLFRRAEAIEERLADVPVLTREIVEDAIHRFIFGDEDHWGDDDAYYDAFGTEREYPPEPETATGKRRKSKLILCESA